MTSCVDANIRTYQTIVTDAYLCYIKHCTIVVCVEVVAYMDILTKVAVEIITNKWIIAY